MIESNINLNYDRDDPVMIYIQNSLQKRGNKMNRYEKAILKEEKKLAQLFKETYDLYYLAQYQAIVMLEVKLDMISFAELDKKVNDIKEGL
jgi:hypothetical protein